MGAALNQAFAAVALASLGACASSSPSLTRGIAPELTQSTFACDRLEGDARSWCGLTSVQAGAGSGHEVYELCRRMEEPLSRDRCLGIAVSRDTAPAPAEVCAYAVTSRWRAWCWTSAAARQARYDVDAAARSCASAGALRSQCAAAVMNERITLLVEGDSVNLAQDVERLTADEPRVAYDPGFGAAIGRTGRELGLLDRRAWPCDALPAGSGRLSCEASFMGEGPRGDGLNHDVNHGAGPR